MVRLERMMARQLAAVREGVAQVALGKVLLGREKMSLGEWGSCATPPFGIVPGILKWPFLVVMMQLSQGVTAADCVSTQDQVSMHTLIRLQVKASFRGRHPSLV